MGGRVSQTTSVSTSSEGLVSIVQGTKRSDKREDTSQNTKSPENKHENKEERKLKLTHTKEEDSETRV
jgi:hypothetical protein